MKRIMFSLLLIIITMPISAQYKPSLGDVLDIITNARAYEDKETWSNEKIYQEVKRIIDKDPDYYINKRLSFRDSKGELFVSGETLLTTAAQYGPTLKSANINLLLRNGADVNAKHPENLCTPLMYAIIYDNWGAFTVLIKHKQINVNSKSIALTYAYQKGCPSLVNGEDICTQLINAGSEIDPELIKDEKFMVNHVKGYPEIKKQIIKDISGDKQIVIREVFPG